MWLVSTRLFRGSYVGQALYRSANVRRDTESHAVANHTQPHRSTHCIVLPAGARILFERWMGWEPDEQAWLTYIKFEQRLVTAIASSTSCKFASLAHRRAETNSGSRVVVR